jgi:hypothetical protein
LAALALLAVLGFGTLSGWLIADAQQPHCPTEDSCVVDYHDGQWHIAEVTP